MHNKREIGQSEKCNLRNAMYQLCDVGQQKYNKKAIIYNK